MGLSRTLRRVAGRSEARVFCVSHSHSRDRARLLRLAPGIQIANTPRAANIMLIVGDLHPGLAAPAIVAHDALAPPRATMWWRGDDRSPLAPASFPAAVVVDDADPARPLKQIHKELVSGEREGEAALLPDVEPAPWRGIGPYGQGGKAMTGGVPYGRPMPERADDRDGLKLDYLPVRVGPLFAPFPPGLALDVKLHGDVIAEATLENFAGASTRGTTIFDRALSHTVPIRDLELARCRSLLYWLSDAVAVAGPASLSERILRLAERVAVGEGDTIRGLERALRRRGFFGWNTRGVGVLKANTIERAGGPVARASGSAVDKRTEDEAYRRIGFDPVVQDAGDASARWVQRIREAAQSLDLAERAGDARAGGSGVIESPRGPLTDGGGPSRAIAKLVPSLVTGMEWGDAVTTVVSLDLDMSEAPVHSIHAGTAS